ncbi:metallophosphoesterase [Mucilaginibacter calamicampi]|uniref:Metallophosphoesterase n=1 Tax=Mucilaginibacter calamicampi TaxID=1302352 RepID=A0ABW2Z2J3_9SPHI
MASFIKRLLTPTVIKLANKYSTRPDKRRVNSALSKLYQQIITNPGKRGLVIPFDGKKDKFIVLSDQHKGSRDGADIFTRSSKNYLAALDHYDREMFTYINLGDSEELWGNTFLAVKKHNKATFENEKRFIKRKAFVKIFGNHDLYWDNDPLAALSLMQIYGEAIPIYEGIVLQTVADNRAISVFMTHGHQGDLQSDGNWFSKWFVSNIWGPTQAFLAINPNTPANNQQLKTDHNRLMYEWSAKQTNTLLITGHTHQPVFRSFTELESIYEKLAHARAANNVEAITLLQNKITALHLKGDVVTDFSAYLDTYFNTGCCCFDDGDITGIEIADECIRLVKWEYSGRVSERKVLEECRLSDLKL